MESLSLWMYGVIYRRGWSTILWHTHMVRCTLVSSLDAYAMGKCVDMLGAECMSTIETTDLKFVVGFVVDGETSNKAIGHIIENIYPHITVPFCMEQT